MNKIYLLLLGLVFVSCQSKKIEKDSELEELFALMQGSFNSENQFETDSSYFNISLHMYPIWEEQGKYLYVEQALNNMQNKPYRQRIYEVKRMTDSTFSSAIYTFSEESLWIGKWRNPGTFDSISINDVSLKPGCEVVLKRIGKHHYRGRTGDTTCVSNLRGASFARSEVEIFKDKIISWDRGFDAVGNHVWGAVKGGYIFDKLN